MPAHVLVTGAAGLIGTAVLDLLADRGVAATALVLDPGAPSPAGPAASDPPIRAGRAASDTTVRAGRVVTGDAADPTVVDRALRDADAVIHLAAIPTPLDDPDEVVFGRNTLATFTVLDRAARAGIRNCAIASSYAICGLPFARIPLQLPYLPIDAALPLQITDPYALSKRVDEETAAMITRRYGMTVVALRLPFVGAADGRLPDMAAVLADDPAHGAPDVWSYLDVRDAARALLAALTPAEPGCHVLYVAAPETLSAQPTEDLLDTFHPGVPRPRFPGRTVPIDLTPARTLLDFTATHPYPLT